MKHELALPLRAVPAPVASHADPAPADADCGGLLYDATDRLVAFVCAYEHAAAIADAANTPGGETR